MSHKAVPHKGRARRRRGKGQNEARTAQPTGQTSAQPTAQGQSTTPRYLKTPQRPKAEAADLGSASEREARFGIGQGLGHGRQEVSQSPQATAMGRAAAQSVAASKTSGKALGPSERAGAEAALGQSFAGIEMHQASPIAAAFGAQALTYDGQIHLAPGMPDLQSPAGQSLLGHELTHVAQQRKYGTTAAQFRIATNSSTEADTGLGQMNIDFSAAHDGPAGGGSDGMEGTISFTPYATAPYSNRIGLLQVADVEVAQPGGGRRDHVWGFGEERREGIKTDQGSFVDKVFASVTPGPATEAWYGAEYGSLDNSSGSNHFGWNRGANDIGDAVIYDFPSGFAGDVYSFETVAKARDSDAVYGVVRWGFEVTGPATTTNEWYDIPKITSSGGQASVSDNFTSALANYRDVIQHEPEILYFDTMSDTPSSSELAKLADASSYMNSHSDAHIELSASADTRGSAAYNRALALRRMGSVQAHLIAQGIDPSRIRRLEASAGESHAQGSQDAALRHSAGSYQANRRVTVRFVRNASSAAPSP
ncbi:MAG: eCIS core domain-containing protein [Mangrovicoccus sp.]